MDNGEYNAINVIRDIIIPKTDDSVAQRVQVFCSFFIVLFLFQVLTSIQFDDEFLLDTDKIGDVITNCVFGDSCRLPPWWRLDAASGSVF